MKVYNDKKFLLFRVFLFTFIILFLSVVFFYTKDYMHFKQIQKHRFERNCSLIETSTVKMAKMIQRGAVLQDRIIDTSLEMALSRLKVYYEEGGSDPYYMDLYGVREKLAYILGRAPESFSLSVINRNGVKIYSTDIKSLGLDFKKWPPFYKQIIRMFDEKKISVDPWSKKLKDPRQSFKYGYIPTSDGLYLLSIGLRGKGYNEEIDEEIDEETSFKKLLAATAGQKNDLIYSAFINVNFRIISTTDGDFDSAMRNLNLDPVFIRGRVREVQSTGESMSCFIEKENLQVDFSYVNFNNTRSAAGDNLNMVLLLVYSTSELNDILKARLKNSLLAVLFILLFFFLGLVVFYSYLSLWLGVLREQLKSVTEGNRYRYSENNFIFGKMTDVRKIWTSINKMLYRIDRDARELKKNSKALHTELELRRNSEKELEIMKQMLFVKLNTDNLTGVYNRRHIMSCLNRELARSKEEKGYLSIILIDIDHFKSINELMGHIFADRILEGLGHFLVETSLERELAGRFGSDEFLVLLPGLSINDAVSRAETMRKGFSAVNFDDVYVTISLGVTSLQVNDSTESLLARAKKLMSLAMESKNKVCSVFK